MAYKWKATAEGDLVSLKTKEEIPIGEYDIIKKKNGQALRIMTDKKKPLLIRRTFIDETAYNFGPGPGEEKAAIREKHASSSIELDSHAAAEQRSVTVTIPREVALEMLQTARMVEDYLLQQLVHETMTK